jgi:hypothetical protein
MVLLGFFGPQSLVSSSSFLKPWQLEAEAAEAVIPEDHPVVVIRAVEVHRGAGN